MTGFEDESDMIFKLFMATIGNEAFVAVSNVSISGFLTVPQAVGREFSTSVPERVTVVFNYSCRTCFHLPHLVSPS